MASFNKYNILPEYLANKTVDVLGTDDTLKVMLSNTAPNAATHVVRSDATEISGGNGYTSGGIDIDNDGTRSSGTVTVTAVDKTWTASGGSVGPARYVVLYDDTPTSPADPLLSWWDYGSSVTLAAGESLTVDFGASLMTIA